MSFQFNPSLPISPEISGFKKTTTLKDRIHCVCLVIDCSTADVLPEKMLEKIKAIQSKIHVRGMVAFTALYRFRDGTVDIVFDRTFRSDVGCTSDFQRWSYLFSDIWIVHSSMSVYQENTSFMPKIEQMGFPSLTFNRTCNCCQSILTVHSLCN